MKVILLQELKGQGGEGDVIEVKRGFAVNWLFPQKLALQATKGNLKQLELRKHNIAKREADRLDGADKIQAALANKVLVIPARVGEEGQLFGSVTSGQIADRLREELGLEVDRKRIEIKSPLKTAGEHTVTVSIYRDVKANLTLEVVDEKTLAAAELATKAAAEDKAPTAEAAEAAECAIEAADGAAQAAAAEAEVAAEAEATEASIAAEEAEAAGETAEAAKEAEASAE